MHQRHHIQLALTTMLAALTLVFSGGFTVIGHRGEYFSNTTDTVEHTFRSYNNALADGADYLEIDLERTSDGVLVINHDPTTSRLSGANYTISQTPWRTISQLPLGKSGEKIHSLEELFQHYRGDQRAKFLIETRPVNGQLVQERELLNLVTKYGLQNRVYYESFSAPSLRLIRQINPQAKTMLLSNTKRELSAAWLAQYPYITSMGIYWDALDGTDVNVLHAAGKQVYPWFRTNETGDAAQDVMSLGTDGVITNWTYKYCSLTGKSRLPAGTCFRAGSDAMLYAGAGAHAANVRTLTSGSLWAVYNQITDRGTTWYELGGNQWVKAPTGTLLPAGQPTPPTQRQVYTVAIPGHPTWGTAVYDRNMKPIRILPAKSKWRIFGERTINGKVYYDLGGQQYIQRAYGIMTVS